MSKRIFFNEVVTRDGFQIEPEFVPTDAKVQLVDALSDCGYAKIEVTSFTAPKAIPMLRDAEEVMGRVRELGSLEDCVEISRRAGWVRPVLDFAHMHATSDGAFVEPEPFREALELVQAVLPAGAPFHVHFSDIAFANRNETKHLPYGEGTLRADPLRVALDGFDRPATVISESPDERSSQAIRAALTA